MNATFQEIFTKYLKEKKPHIEPGSYHSLIKLRDKIEMYEQKQKKTLLLSDMNLDFFNHFVKGMATGKYGKCTNRTLKLYINIINGFLSQCTIFGYTVNDDYIKFRERLKRLKVPKSDRPFLLDEELAMIWKFKGFLNKSKKFIPLTAAKKKVKDLFIFQTQVGLRWSDIARLKRKDLFQKGGKWYILNFNTKKKERNVSVQLNQLALKVVLMYCPKFETMAANRPIFRSVSDVANATHTLKWIAEKCGLNRVVTVRKGKLDKVIVKKKTIAESIATHMARYKFATDWILAGKDIYLLKIILGHASIKTTEKYIRMVENWLPPGLETGLDETKLELFEVYA